MFSPLERMIAFRYLRSKRKEGFISINAGFSLVGIALGVATLIVVMAVMNGFRAEITKKILGINGHVSVSSYEREMKYYDEFVDALKGLDGVVSAVPIINGQAMAVAGRSTTGVIVKGLEIDDLLRKKIVADNIKEGKIADFKGSDNIILGEDLAFNLGVTVGDKVKLISPEGSATALGTLPRYKSYNVVATFKIGMYEYDSSVIFMPLKAAQIFFKYPDSVSGVEIITDDANRSDYVAEDVYTVMDGYYKVQDWKTMNAGLFNALKVERTVMFLILTLIVFIAAFNIISSLIMLVNDKGKDIAILRTMGATKSVIMSIFFICGSSIGFVGTFSGFILGIGFASNIESIRKWLESLIGTKLFDPVIYFLSELPADVQANDVLWAVAMGLICSFLATIYPVYKASKQNPAEALRYE